MVSLGCPELVGLAPSFCRMITDRSVQAVIRNCLKLVALDMEYTQITYESLAAVIGTHRQIKLWTRNAQVTSLGLKAFQRAFPGMLMS